MKLYCPDCKWFEEGFCKKRKTQVDIKKLRQNVKLANKTVVYGILGTIRKVKGDVLYDVDRCEDFNPTSLTILRVMGEIS